ncbi:MAG: hypothetical protein SPG42_04850, partial [Candidatus Cryptobacteroides sp.]|nr:hypothetical protein [Candidatus Cryptobacteroides sp.]
MKCFSPRNCGLGKVILNEKFYYNHYTDTFQRFCIRSTDGRFPTGVLPPGLFHLRPEIPRQPVSSRRIHLPGQDIPERIRRIRDSPTKEANNWSLFSVKGGSLTIKGAGTLQAKENDCYAVDVQDGGQVVIEDGTYVGNVHAVYVFEGTAEIKGGKYSIQQPSGLPSPYGYVLNCYDANRKNG